VRALVTGGGGFLGSRIVAMLQERGDDVTALGRSEYPHLEALGVRTVRVDVRDAQAVRQACRGMDVVFHAAAIPGIWGPRELYYSINTLGTRNVIAACRAAGVGRLVHTSSPSVVLGGGPVRGGDESIPYPGRYLAAYPWSKALAEKEVLAAHQGPLRTVALRPHLVFGPGDPNLLPRIIARARHKRLVQVGDGRNRVDLTYIDDAARAHLRAADELHAAARCAGKAYFITQGEPVVLWEWIAQVLEALGLPPVRRGISSGSASCVGTVLEWVFRACRVGREPPMTRFLADQLSQDHYFSIRAAARDFGFAPSIPMSVATHQTLARLRR